jgi:hypothetical protein
LRQRWEANHRSQERGPGDAGHAFHSGRFRRAKDHVGRRLVVNDISAMASSTPGIGTTFPQPRGLESA